jgi:hypothetical protein
LSPVANALLGGVAGGVGAFLTNPMDVVMTRVNLAAATPGGARGGVWATACGVLRAEGVAAFGKGVGPRLAHKVPANAVFFLVYELGRALFGVGSGAGAR